MLEYEEEIDPEFYELMKEEEHNAECEGCMGCMKCYMLSWRDFA